MVSLTEWAARWRVRLHLPLGIVYLFFARPVPWMLAAGAGVIALGLLVRTWAAGHLQKETGVTVSGPYAHVRHPLYLGTGIIFAGLAVASAQPGLAVMVALYFLFFYVPALKREEQERGTGSPDLYALYRALVPALAPRLRPARFRQPAADSARRFAMSRYRVNGEWRAAAGCAAVLLLLYAKIVLG